jgi:glycosyltransferase involved in cell wall biosynthesis
MRGVVKVALLTNFVPPYRLPLYQAIEKKVKEFKIFLSAETEPNRDWEVEWSQLDVQLQKALKYRKQFRHPNGFVEEAVIYIPYNQLWELKTFKPDVIISSEMGSRTLLSAIYKQLSKNVKLIIWATVSEESEKSRGKIREYLRKMLLSQADAVITNGNSGARYLAKFQYPIEKIFHVPYVVENHLFNHIKINFLSSHTALIYTGQLIERKGILPFIDCLFTWASRNPVRFIDLYIAGSGPLTEVIQAIPSLENVHIHLLGNVSYQDLPAVYAKGHIFVFPTYSDEWGVVVNEAMAAGLPVLGSKYSQAVDELVQEGVHGWKFHPDDPHEMMMAFNEALTSSHEKLGWMSSNCRKKISEYSIDSSADKMVNVIRFVKGGNPSGDFG